MNSSCVLLLFTFFIVINANNFNKPLVEDYLQSQIDRAKNFLIDSFNTNRILNKRDISKLDFQIESVFNIPNELHKNGFLVVMRNELFFFLNNKMYHVDIHSEKIDFTLRYTFNSGYVRFLKTITYKDNIFLLVSYSDGVSQIYISASNYNSWTLRQTIMNSGLAVDAAFSLADNELYLILLNSKKRSLVPSGLYKWTGTHFDETEKILTTEPTSVIFLNSHLLVLAQFVQHVPEIGTLLMHLQNNKLRRIQFLDSKGFYTLTSYTFNEQIYLFLLNKDGESSIYFLRDMELIKWVDFNEPVLPLKVQFHEMNNTLLCFFALKDGIVAYSINANGFSKVGKINLMGNSEILDIVVVSVKNSLGIFTVINNSESIEGKIFYINLHKFLTQNQIISPAFPINCLDNLYKRLTFEASLINDIKRNTENIKKKKLISITAGANFVKESNITNVNTNEKMVDFKELNFNASLAASKAIELEDKASHLIHSSRNNKINGDLNIQRDLKCKHLSVKLLNVKTINKKPWIHENWLKRLSSQTIDGPVSCNKLHINHLRQHVNSTFLKGLLLSEGAQKITGKYVLKSLTARNIVSSIINNISFTNIIVKQTNLKQHIEGTKSFKNMNVSNLNLSNWNKNNVLNWIPNVHTMKFLSNINVTALNVKTVNNVTWDNFVESLFLNQVRPYINGTLTLKSHAFIENLKANYISDYAVNNLITTSTDQVTNTTINFHNMKMKNLRSFLVNNISLKNQLVVLDRANLITGPVSLLNLQIDGDLKLNETLNSILNRLELGDPNFLQIYNGPVRVKGNVQIKNINFKPLANIIVQNNLISTDAIKDYWLKNSHQIVKAPVIFSNGLTSLTLTTSYLNNVSSNLYVYDNINAFEIWPRLQTLFLFKNVEIKNNVILYQTTQTIFPNPRVINESAVFLSGRYDIYGLKNFTQKLIVNSIVTEYLDGLNVTALITRNNFCKSTEGKKKFTNLIINGSFLLHHDAHLEIDSINGKNPRKFFPYTVFANKPETVKFLNANKILANNINTEKINGFNVSELLFNMQQQLNKVTIDGNVMFQNVLIAEVNNIQFSKYINKLIIQSEPNININSFKQFSGTVFINSLTVKNLAGVNIVDFLRNSLSRVKAQNISEKYYFNIIRTEWLNTQLIDKISTSEIIDISSDDLLIINTPLLSFKSVTILGSITTNLYHGDVLLHIDESLNRLSPRLWNTVVIVGNVIISNSSAVAQNTLLHLIDKAVQLEKSSVITGKVTFYSGATCQNMNFLKHINNINLLNILNDALFKNGNGQHIIGNNNFAQDLHVLFLDTYANTKIDVINTINIIDFNQSLVRPYSDKVTGKKIFQGGITVPQLKVFQTIGGINIDPNLLVSYENPRLLPATLFIGNLTVMNNLELENINKNNFSSFLKSIIYLKSNELQHIMSNNTFQHTYIKDFASMESINNLRLSKIIIDSGKQYIFASKEFVDTISAEGNIKVNWLNGLNLTPVHEKSWLVDKNMIIEGNVKFTQVVNFNSSLTTNYINNAAISELHQNALINNSLSLEVTNLIENVKEIQHQSLELSKNMANVFLFIEPYNEMRIPVNRASAAHVTEIKGGITMNILEKMSGDMCSLESECSCFVQHSVQISEYGSVQLLNSNSSERLYNFYDQHNDTDTIINVITTTLSSGPNCSLITNGSKYEETTRVAWVTRNNKLNTSEIHIDDIIMEGYLSSVKYFRVGNNLYIILAAYYDSVGDSHNTYCSVLRMDQNKIKLIQRLPSWGAWTLEVMQTAQGIVLVIGNIYDSNEHTSSIDAEIYRFNVITEQFELLRAVATIGVTAIASVVLDKYDSLIILGQRQSPMLVLKYHPKYDNYVFYQSIQFDSPVYSINVFHSEKDNNGDIFLCVSTDGGFFYIYSYQYIQGWTLESRGEVNNFQEIVPFTLAKQPYIFAPSKDQINNVFVVNYQGIFG